MLDSNEARDDGVAVAPAGPYANRLHQITMPAPNHRAAATAIVVTTNCTYGE